MALKMLMSNHSLPSTYSSQKCFLFIAIFEYYLRAEYEITIAEYGELMDESLDFKLSLKYRKACATRYAVPQIWRHWLSFAFYSKLDPCSWSGCHEEQLNCKTETERTDFVSLTRRKDLASTDTKANPEPILSPDLSSKFNQISIFNPVASQSVCWAALSRQIVRLLPILCRL